MTTLNFDKKRDYELKVTDKKEEPEENTKKKVKNDVWNGNTDYPSVEIYKNHIFFILNGNRISSFLFCYHIVLKFLDLIFIIII